MELSSYHWERIVDDEYMSVDPEAAVFHRYEFTTGEFVIGCVEVNIVFHCSKIQDDEPMVFLVI